jgi:hypothetical protein
MARACGVLRILSELLRISMSDEITFVEKAPVPHGPDPRSLRRESRSAGPTVAEEFDNRGSWNGGRRDPARDWLGFGRTRRHTAWTRAFVASRVRRPMLRPYGRPG